MSQLESAVLPLVAMLVAFLVMGVALFLTRRLALWLEKKKTPQSRHEASATPEDRGRADDDEPDPSGNP